MLSDIMPAFIDYTGKKIGRVVVVENIERGVRSLWNCLCDCGNNFQSEHRSFKRGETFECGDCRQERKRGVDLTGRKYGRWTVIARELNKHNKTVWLVKCDCGALGKVATCILGTKKSMSCGCFGRKKKSKYVNDTLYPPEHKKALTRIYCIRVRITQSCYNEKSANYRNYGAKGYTVCELWKNGALDFYKWCIENGWEHNHVVGITEGKTEFNPENCYIMPEGEYRSMVMQKKVTYEGVTKTAAEWSKIGQVKSSTILTRLNNGYSIEHAIFARRWKFSGFTQTYPDEEIKRLYETGLSLADVGKKLGIYYHTISKRLRAMGIVPDMKGRRVYRERECSVCGIAYVPTNSNQKICSAECKKRSRRKNP